MDLFYIYATAAVVLTLFAFQVLTRKIDPFAPVWLFLVGYVQVYIIQPISYHEWALRTRGPELLNAANLRILWALLWFLAVYYCGLPRLIARSLPRPPARWSATTVGVISPLLIAWGLFCAGLVIRAGGSDGAEITAEQALLMAFPFVMLVGAVLLVVTGRHAESGRPLFLAAGMATGAFYVLIWMFNGKRSHSLVGVLATVCAFYVSKQRRPSWPVLIGTAVLGVMAVAVAIGWRNDRMHQRSVSGFIAFLGDFDPGIALESLNMSTSEGEARTSFETEEYGGYLVMMTATPANSDYDYGSPYLRVFSTYIPRIVWPDKPIYGRDQWVSAWIAGSEMKRESNFTGPAISLLGACQLNGGAVGTLIVLAVLAFGLRTAYDYFRHYSDHPWVQAWWPVSFFSAWFMVVNDDPAIWFYYNWGFTTFPVLIMLWFTNKLEGVTR